MPIAAKRSPSISGIKRPEEVSRDRARANLSNTNDQYRIGHISKITKLSRAIHILIRLVQETAGIIQPLQIYFGSSLREKFIHGLPGPLPIAVIIELNDSACRNLIVEIFQAYFYA